MSESQDHLGEGVDAALLEMVTNSLHIYGAGYVRRASGDLQYDGERPGEGWRAHGYFWRWLYVLVGLELTRVRTGTTASDAEETTTPGQIRPSRHSPDEPPFSYL